MERNEERVNEPGRGTARASGTATSGRSAGEAPTAETGRPGPDSGTSGTGASTKSGSQPAAGAAAAAQERAAELKANVADKLEAGAEKLRYRTREGAERVAAMGADMGAVATQRLNRYSDSVATRMERTAGWLRGGDMADLGDVIAEQVQQHPTRTLLITLGVGYLLGRLVKD